MMRLCCVVWLAGSLLGCLASPLWPVDMAPQRGTPTRVQERQPGSKSDATRPWYLPEVRLNFVHDFPLPNESLPTEKISLTRPSDYATEAVRQSSLPVATVTKPQKLPASQVSDDCQQQRWQWLLLVSEATHTFPLPTQAEKTGVEQTAQSLATWLLLTETGLPMLTSEK